MDESIQKRTCLGQLVRHHGGFIITAHKDILRGKLPLVNSLP